MPEHDSTPEITVWHEADVPTDPVWEAAYQAFETPQQEVAKFTARLHELGAARWSRDAHVVEMFCGRGNGLVALHAMGFRNLEGVDLSRPLLEAYRGPPAQLYAGDCRKLEYPDSSRDILIVQGGLHHLPKLPEDFEATLAEVCRVLHPSGRFAFVEPWDTPFLRFVHAVARQSFARSLWPRIDAFQTMVENEIETYSQWLRAGAKIQAALRRRFTCELQHVRWGKMCFVGRPKATGIAHAGG